MLTWEKYKSGKIWIVKWSDGKAAKYLTEQKALEAINDRFFKSIGF